MFALDGLAIPPYRITRENLQDIPSARESQKRSFAGRGGGGGQANFIYLLQPIMFSTVSTAMGADCATSLPSATATPDLSSLASNARV